MGGKGSSQRQEIQQRVPCESLLKGLPWVEKWEGCGGLLQNYAHEKDPRCAYILTKAIERQHLKGETAKERLGKARYYYGVAAVEEAFAIAELLRHFTVFDVYLGFSLFRKLSVFLPGQHAAKEVVSSSLPSSSSMSFSITKERRAAPLSIRRLITKKVGRHTLAKDTYESMLRALPNCGWRDTKMRDYYEVQGIGKDLSALSGLQGNLSWWKGLMQFVVATTDDDNSSSLYRRFSEANGLYSTVLLAAAVIAGQHDVIHAVLQAVSSKTFEFKHLHPEEETLPVALGIRGKNTYGVQLSSFYKVDPAREFMELCPGSGICKNSMVVSSYNNPLALATINGDHVAMRLLLDHSLLPAGLKHPSVALLGNLQPTGGPGGANLANQNFLLMSPRAHCLLSVAVENSDVEGLEILLKYRKTVFEVEHPGDDCESLDRADRFDTLNPGNGEPILLAAMRGDYRCLKLLLEAGADPNFSNSDFPPPLVLAINGGHLSSVEALLEYKANPNLSSPSDGTTPLHHACSSSSSATATKKIDEGTATNGIELLLTSMIVKKLLEAGADPNKEDVFHQKPRDLLKSNKSLSEELRLALTNMLISAEAAKNSD